MSRVEYSIVIPVYNSTSTLYQLATRIDRFFNLQEKASYEIIFVNDCSSNPETREILKDIREKYENVTVLSLSRNYGQQAATLCGLNESTGRYVITMDDDLQHTPEELAKLIEMKNHDVVIGNFRKKKHGLLKVMTSKIKGHFDSIIFGKPGTLQLTSFRLISRCIVDGIPSIKTPYPMLGPMMFYLTRDVVGVGVEHDSRRHGKSNYNLAKRFKMFTNLLINNSSYLLKMIGYLGIGISLLSILMGLWLIIHKMIYQNTPVGWTSVIVSVLFIGGLLLFSTGIIGEYLIRIITTIEQKPMYHICEKFEKSRKT